MWDDFFWVLSRIMLTIRLLFAIEPAVSPFPWATNPIGRLTGESWGGHLASDQDISTRGLSALAHCGMLIIKFN